MQPSRPDASNPVAPTVQHDIVLVDDAADLRMLLRVALAREGSFRVVAEGGTGIEAVELAARFHPALMLLDVSMPEMDGITALPRVTAAAPRTRVVMFSGFDGRGLETAARELGAAGYLDKGLPLSELTTRLHHILDSADKADALGEVEGDDAEVHQLFAVAEPTQSGFDGHVEYFGMAFDAATIAMTSLTLAGSIVHPNAAMCELTRLDRRQLAGLSLADLAVDDERVEIRARVASLARGEAREFTIEHRVMRADGSVRWASTGVGAVEDGSGSALYLFAQLADVTDRRAAEEALRRSEERYRTLVETALEGVWTFDEEGRATLVDRRAD